MDWREPGQIIRSGTATRPAQETFRNAPLMTWVALVTSCARAEAVPRGDCGVTPGLAAGCPKPDQPWGDARSRPARSRISTHDWLELYQAIRAAPKRETGGSEESARIVASRYVAGTEGLGFEPRRDFSRRFSRPVHYRSANPPGRGRMLPPMLREGQRFRAGPPTPRPRSQRFRWASFRRFRRFSRRAFQRQASC